MSDIKFKFDYSNETNMLYIEGTKELCGKNYVCSVRGSLCDMNLQETLDKIRMTIQDKIINDLLIREELDEINKINFTFNKTGKDVGIKLDGDYYNTYEDNSCCWQIGDNTDDTLKCKLDKLEKTISALDCKVNELIK